MCAGFHVVACARQFAAEQTGNWFVGRQDTRISEMSSLNGRRPSHPLTCSGIPDEDNRSGVAALV